jgi:DNA-directed RNA polymerase specialized sigma24 family protein
VAGSVSDTEYDRFFRESERTLLRQAYLLTGNVQEAQDLTQETLLRVWRRRGS